MQTPSTNTTVRSAENYNSIGSKGWIFTMLASIVLMFGAVVIYYELMTQAIYPCLNALIYWIFGVDNPFDPSLLTFKHFSLSYTCIIVTAVLFPVVCKRDFSVFIKINSYGVLFVIAILVFLFGYGFYSLSNTSFIISNLPD